jgi:outer membrane protein OmpA-like peptidoglycan-associated protein
MAALRAMQQVQQVQHHATDSSNGPSQVVNQLAAMARERDERFQHEQEQRKLQEEEQQRLRMQVKREEELFGDDEYDLPSSTKRRLSQVDSPEDVMRPVPSFVVPTYTVCAWGS